MLKQRDLILLSHYYEGFFLSIFEIIKKTRDMTNLIKSSNKVVYCILIKVLRVLGLYFNKNLNKKIIINYFIT